MLGCCTVQHVIENFVVNVMVEVIQIYAIEYCVTCVSSY